MDLFQERAPVLRSLGATQQGFANEVAVIFLKHLFGACSSPPALLFMVPQPVWEGKGLVQQEERAAPWFLEKHGRQIHDLQVLPQRQAAGRELRRSACKSQEADCLVGDESAKTRRKQSLGDTLDSLRVPSATE